MHESAGAMYPQLATPRRYVTFLHTYETVYSQKKKGIEEKQKHLQAGVSKLNDAKKVVDKLKRKANEQSQVMKPSILESAITTMYSPTGNYNLRHCLYYKEPNKAADIVLFKMFSQWFYANEKLIITLRTSKFGDVT